MQIINRRTKSAQKKSCIGLGKHVYCIPNDNTILNCNTSVGAYVRLTAVHNIMFETLRCILVLGFNSTEQPIQVRIASESRPAASHKYNVRN